MSEIVNRVAQSSIIPFNLEEIYPKEERVIFDLKIYLFEELILREKEFRKELRFLDWEVYRDKWVAITCTADAIVPNWAFMLVATYLQPMAKGFVIGSEQELEVLITEKCIAGLERENFKDKSVVIKGCSDFPIPLYAYGRLISFIQDEAKSIMYGEPCSTVPLYKKPKA